MSRPREFDEQEVVAKALDLFWVRGYDAATVADLMEATGLAKGSLYKAFGDKKSLFMLALDSFLNEANKDLCEYAASFELGREALERILGRVVRASTCGGLRRGCFSVNSIIELAPHDAEVRKLLRRGLRQTERMFANIIRRGVADGSLRKGLDPEVRARSMTVLTNGLHVKGKLGLTREQAKEAVATAIEALV